MINFSRRVQPHNEREKSLSISNKKSLIFLATFLLSADTVSADPALVEALTKSIASDTEAEQTEIYRECADPKTVDPKDLIEIRFKGETKFGAAKWESEYTVNADYEDQKKTHSPYQFIGESEGTKCGLYPDVNYYTTYDVTNIPAPGVAKVGPTTKFNVTNIAGSSHGETVEMNDTYKDLAWLDFTFDHEGKTGKIHCWGGGPTIEKDRRFDKQFKSGTVGTGLVPIEKITAALGGQVCWVTKTSRKLAQEAIEKEKKFGKPKTKEKQSFEGMVKAKSDAIHDSPAVKSVSTPSGGTSGAKKAAPTSSQTTK